MKIVVAPLSQPFQFEQQIQLQLSRHSSAQRLPPVKIKITWKKCCHDIKQINFQNKIKLQNICCFWSSMSVRLKQSTLTLARGGGSSMWSKVMHQVSAIAVCCGKAQIAWTLETYTAAFCLSSICAELVFSEEHYCFRSGLYLKRSFRASLKPDLVHSID